jgi:hypothetical protein
MASKYHNLSNEALVDEIGRVDAIAKAAETELKEHKEEFKARGLKQAIGEMTEVTATSLTIEVTGPDRTIHDFPRCHQRRDGKALWPARSLLRVFFSASVKIGRMRRVQFGMISVPDRIGF